MIPIEKAASYQIDQISESRCYDVCFCRCRIIHLLIIKKQIKHMLEFVYFVYMNTYASASCFFFQNMPRHMLIFMHMLIFVHSVQCVSVSALPKLKGGKV